MDNEKQHIHHIMLYEFRKGKTVGAATKDIRKVYLDRAPGLRTVTKWFAKFRSGDFNLEDQPRSGRPSELDDDVVRTLVVNNSRISTEEVASELNVHKSTAFRRLKKIGYTLKLDTWVPHQLSEKNKVDRMTTAISLLERIKNEPFLDRLVTGDEKWILYNNVQRKRTWKQAHEGAEPVAKGETITADKYCQQLVELKKVIEEKRPILSNRKGVLFHHDNARPHVAKPTLAKLKEMNWEIMPHPPYSPDIALSDYHLFRSLQNNLNGKKIKNVEDVKNHLDTFFNEKPRNFYESGIRKLVERWEWIAEHDGKYIID
ncbi:histone-lysine N-methyltransferase SETMAR-like [Phlebotomus papatasi]|uniref:histone-lysine N-methyltransferase SETMAR-like n=1 Tax=Phlebotomus papatasi TaxID=29031 RepID=UPI00248378DE|nr:histone-lysine N-methyltransferase SETMAR-like [Phlebotomus papatasi]